MPGRFFLKNNLPSGNLKGFSENGIETWRRLAAQMVILQLARRAPFLSTGF
jgi:hypothetical protein